MDAQKSAKFMKIMGTILMVVVVFIVIVQILSFFMKDKDQNVSPSSSAEKTNYYDVQKGFEFQYPKNWEKVQVQGGYGFIAPNGVNFNVLMEDLSSNPLSLEEYSSLSEQNLTKAIADYQLIESKSGTVAGQTSRSLLYTATGSDGTKLKVLSTWFLQNNKAYVLTYSGEPAVFDVELTTSSEIINSFQVK